MKKHDQMRKMMEEISDMHIQEAADALSGETQISEQETRTHRRNSWLWAGLAAAGVVALLGAATVNLHKNSEQLQTGSQSVEQQNMVSGENDAETLPEDGFDITTEDGETLHVDTHIYTSDEVENAVIIRDHLDIGGKEAQIWYADMGDYMYRGMQSEGVGIWYHFQVNDNVGSEIYKTYPYLHFIKNIDGVLYNMEVWGTYENGKANILVTITDEGKDAKGDITGSKTIDFGYDISDSGTVEINGISAGELYKFLEPVCAFAEGADLVFVRGPRGICPAEEQPDLSDGYAKLSLFLPMISEEYYDEFLGRYGTMQEQLSALITGRGM